MSNQRNTNIPVDNNDQGVSEPYRHRSRNFYRSRPQGSERQNQDLGEDENRGFQDGDTQHSNDSDYNDQHVNNVQGRGGRRGGFRRFRGRGHFNRGYLSYGNQRVFYSPYANYMNGRGGLYFPPEIYHDRSYYDNRDDRFEPNNGNEQTMYGYRGNQRNRGGRGRYGQNDQIATNVTPMTDNSNNDPTNVDKTNNEQQLGENNTRNKRRYWKRRQRKERQLNNENGVNSEQQQTVGAVTDDHQKDESNQDSTRQQPKKSSQQRHRQNTNPTQTGTEINERPKSTRMRKPQDDEAIVKNVVRFMVNKVVRRLAPRYRRRSYQRAKEVNNNNVDNEKSQSHIVAGQRDTRRGNGYFMEQGYYDPYGITSYYYGMHFNYSNRGFGGRGRGRGGRNRGRFRQRKGANKENQPENNSEEVKTEVDGSSQNKTPINEQVNQSLKTEVSN